MNKKLTILLILTIITINAVSCADTDILYAYNIPVFSNCLKDTKDTGTEWGNFVFHRNDTFDGEGIIVNNSDYTIPEKISSEMFDHINSGRQNAGFYVIDINTEMSFGYNADYEFFSASTIKAGYALFCFKEISKGNATFTDVVKYEKKHYISGSGSTQRSVYGTLFTVKVLLYRMLYESDNIAYYMLIDKFGLDGYNNMVTNLGCTNTLSASSKWGNLSPHELGLIWEEIYYFRDTCEEGALLWKYLTENLFNEIKTSLPEYDIVAHKSGWSDNACHDAGVVMSDTPYIVIVMSENYSYHSYIHKIIKYIDKIMKDYNAPQ